MKQIKIRIKPNGSTEIEAVGFTGVECTTATQPYESALGTHDKRTIKPEMYETEQTQSYMTQDF